MRFGSLFAGVGGFDVGLERAGMRCDWQAEIDPKAQAVLRRRFPHAQLYDDVRKVDGSARRVDLVCGGFPCQDLSVAGRRKGLAGERSGLWWEFHRVLAELRPAWCVIENVPGLLSSNDGRDMGTILGCLGDLGYGFAYRVLDAQWTGVAQRRRRVFIVGHLGDGAGPAEVLLEPEGSVGDSAPSRQAGTRVAALTSSGVGTCGADDNQAQAGHLVPDVARCLTTSNERIDGESETFVPIAFHQTQEPIHGDGFSPALGTTSMGMGVAFSENQRGEVLETEYSHQITTGGGKPGQGYPAVRQGLAVRRLTPKECERLQGFPDDWTDDQVDSARYKQMGNAVCVNVAEWIGRRLVAVDARLRTEEAA